MNYTVNARAEAGWFGVIAPATTLLGAILVALDVPQEITVPAVGLFAALLRPLIGALLPTPAS